MPNAFGLCLNYPTFSFCKPQRFPQFKVRMRFEWKVKSKWDNFIAVDLSLPHAVLVSAEKSGWGLHEFIVNLPVCIKIYSQICFTDLAGNCMLFFGQNGYNSVLSNNMSKNEAMQFMKPQCRTLSWTLCFQIVPLRSCSWHTVGSKLFQSISRCLSTYSDWSNIGPFLADLCHMNTRKFEQLRNYTCLNGMYLDPSWRINRDYIIDLGSTLSLVSGFFEYACTYTKMWYVWSVFINV